MADEDDRERVRQSERTVDNLKRLYAVLFSISFGVVAVGAVGKLKAYQDPSLPYDWPSFFVHVELTATFVITAGLFYYQGDRFLDITFAKAPLRPVSAFDFGVDYLVNVFTMAPFYLMATALGGDVIAAAGFFWFFASYCLLIVLGLTLLFAREGWRLVHGASHRGLFGGLQAFWMIMNAGMLLVVLAIFMAFRHNGEACPLKVYDAHPPIFLWLFGALVLARDYLDFTHAWALLYPVDVTLPSGQPRRVIQTLARDGSVGRWKLFGFVLTLCLGGMIVWGELYRLPDLARACGH